MIKNVLKSSALLALGGGFLFLMQKLNFLRLADIASAFHERPGVILGLACVQAIAAFVMMIRYGTLLGVLGLAAPFKQVSSATFVSTAVGQWAPGSLAVVELLRVGLMIGSQPENIATDKVQQQHQGIKARIAIASFVDRLIGFLGILVLGFICSVYLVFGSSLPSDLSGFLTGPGLLLLSSGMGMCALVSLPLLVRLKWVRHLGAMGVRKHAMGGSRSVVGILATLLRHFETVRHNIEVGSRKPRRLLAPVCLSMLSLLLTSFSLYLAANALGESLDFIQIVCAYPLISLSAILPLGFAGIGGYQLIMASIFGLFAVSPAVVASSGVLQSAVVLVVNTLMGLLYARVCSGQIKAIFRQPASGQSL
ncbi:MAG: lysylphosphatidylglycerol synthase domain-containing protein [Silvanigrellaceae bacterium]